MFLAEPQTTKFDLHFSVGKIPVRVHPMFWLISIIFGAVAVRGASINIFVGMALWTAAVFVSILTHELGHAVTAKAYGWPPRIVLHSMGGLAIFSPGSQSRKQRILIDFMGPGAGFIFGGLIFAGVLLSGHSANLLPGIGVPVGSGPPLSGGGRLELFVLFLLYVNIFWGLINLVPVQPLDGGHIAKAIIEKFRPRDAWPIALKLGIGTAGVLAVTALLVSGDFFIAIMFGLLGYNNYQMLQQVQAHR
ncbi:site-2 protease family protein [Enhygromyxa salina]|uniref:Peptidase family M50 n=1 Tax=Enhygromyxa salina TaxID=215803 RepID=A0A2S9XPH4_9BACT|nr:site-2 protease family protein [Enhygromyxa salina]PRP94769.1 Peptidase family M50 [Enhygromyxa salina]